jgi:hypothetical protein
MWLPVFLVYLIMAKAKAQKKAKVAKKTPKKK